MNLNNIIKILMFYLKVSQSIVSGVLLEIQFLLVTVVFCSGSCFLCERKLVFSNFIVNVSVPTTFMYSLIRRHAFHQHGNDKEGTDTLKHNLGVCILLFQVFLEHLDIFAR